MLRLNNLKSPKGAHRKTKRLGRGAGSGQGTQAGKGHKGQKARSGGGVRTGFEGGAMPLYMRLPKKGFKNAPFRTVYAEVSLGAIDAKFKEGEVSRQRLVEKGMLKGRNKTRPIKVLANGELTRKLTFIDIDKFTKTAAQAIEKVGGVIEKKVSKSVQRGEDA